MITMKVFCKGAHKPSYATEGSAGLDLCYNGKIIKNIANKGIEALETGVHVEIPKGYVGIVAIRSGLGFKGLDLVNSIGVIDEDYRGEVGLKVVNNSGTNMVIEPGERVAQLILVPYIQPKIEFINDVSQMSETKRGHGGFGHTGRFNKGK